jgi:hypothetical protein
LLAKKTESVKSTWQSERYEHSPYRLCTINK